MSDVTITPQAVPYSQNATAGGNINLGSPVYGSASGTVSASIANTSRPATSPTLGLALNPAAVGQPVAYQFAGTLQLTEAQWEAIIDGGGAPSIGVAYYVSPTTPGNITSTEPTGGNEVTPVGVFLTTSIFQIGPMPSVPSSVL